jgi:UDP-3-O-[3-hydroxymyristoyl] glucosamine N-acyltransferase
MKTVQEIADLVDGHVHGDGALEIRTVGSLERATRGTLAYAEGKHLAKVDATEASCVLIPDIEPPARTVIVVAKPRVAFARAAQWLLPPRLPDPGVHETALVSPDSTLGANVSIGAWTIVEPGAAIGPGTVILPGGYVGAGATIGANCVLYPRVVLYPGTTVGDRVILHAGVVIGSDGFGFVFDGERQIKVPQVGRAQIGDDVEIGANACIDRGALDETVIAEGVKIDNLCHLGHNVRIGDHSVISAQTGIAGSSTVGREAIIGGQVGIADYCRVDDHGIVGAQCGIPSRKRVPAGQPFWGTPARPLKDIKKQQGYIHRLPRMASEIASLRAELDALKARLDE